MTNKVKKLLFRLAILELDVSILDLSYFNMIYLRYVTQAQAKPLI